MLYHQEDLCLHCRRNWQLSEYTYATWNILFTLSIIWMVLYWSRDDLFAFSRVRCDIEQGLRETVSRLSLRWRGRRAGRCRPVAVGFVTSPLPALNVNNNKRSADYAAAAADSTAVQHQLPASIIPTVIGRRTLSTYRRQHPARKRVLIHIERSPSSVQSNNVSWQQPASSASHLCRLCTFSMLLR